MLLFVLHEEAASRLWLGMDDLNVIMLLCSPCNSSQLRASDTANLTMYVALAGPMDYINAAVKALAGITCCLCVSTQGSSQAKRFLSEPET